RIVRRRGQLMQEAAPVGTGGMIAVIQPELDVELVARVADEHGVDVASYNSPSQMVLSGPLPALDGAAAKLRRVVAARSGRLAPLAVSAPFHSRAMRAVEAPLRRLLEEGSDRIDALRARAVTSNYTGGWHAGTRDELVEALVRQVSAPVRWIDNMRALAP